MERFYTSARTESRETLISTVTNLNHEITLAKNTCEIPWAAIQEKLRYQWTYDTNAIEGSTLTLGETIFYLREGLTVGGKPLKDFLDARNHDEAIDMLYDVIKNERPLSEGLLKEMNGLLLLGVTHTRAIDSAGHRAEKPVTPGAYKLSPNHVLQLDGTIHYYVEPVKVHDEMEHLVGWVNKNIDKEHPLITAGVAHYNMVRIHPFDDGNGRGARLLMNLILIKKGYPPAMIHVEDRKEYIGALEEGDKGDLVPFLLFIGKSLAKTQQTILDILQGNSGVPCAPEPR